MSPPVCFAVSEMYFETSGQQQLFIPHNLQKLTYYPIKVDTA